MSQAIESKSCIDKIKENEADLADLAESDLPCAELAATLLQVVNEDAE